MRETTPREDLIRGIWKENPVLVQLLGLCPALAVTNTVPNAIAMGLATFFVLMGSSLLGSRRSSDQRVTVPRRAADGVRGANRGAHEDRDGIDRPLWCPPGTKRDPHARFRT